MDNPKAINGAIIHIKKNFLTFVFLKIFNITLLENIQGMGDDIKVDEDFRGNYRIDLIYHHALDHNAERIKDKIGFIFNQLNNKTLLSQLGVQVNYALLGGCFKNE